MFFFSIVFVSFLLLSSVLCEFLDKDIKALVDDIHPDQVVLVTDSDLKFVSIEDLQISFHIVYVNTNTSISIANIGIHNSLIILLLNDAATFEAIFTNATLHSLQRNIWIAVSNLPIEDVFQFAYPGAKDRKRLSLWSQLYFLEKDAEDCCNQIIEVLGNANQAPTFHVSLFQVCL